uniref:Esterase n=1 Tax=Aspergillus westerdijkiae TaxID=357447 RepID=A0A2P2CLB3_9EURO|nr:TPA_exp: esterase [Aspergillus westerdijkiae]
MNYVADYVPSDLLPIPPISPETSLPELVDKPIKILMIHGHGSSSSRLFYKYRALQPSTRHEILHALHRDVEFYFPNAPILPAGFEPGMWTWGLGDYRVDRVPRLQESITYLVRYMEEHGPFDGIIGSSAGASVAVLVGSLLEGGVLREGCEEVKMVTTHPPLKFILSYSGFKMSHVCYRAIYRPKIQTPVMHFIGNLDTYIPGPLTLQLARRCINHKVVYFHGCHYIPRLGGTTMAAAGFMCDCLGGGKRVVGKGEGNNRDRHRNSQGGDVEEVDGEKQENDDDGEWEWVEDEKIGDWVAKLL